MNAEPRAIQLAGKHAVGAFAQVIVDAADYERLAVHRWKCSPPHAGGHRYAVRNVRIDGKQLTLYMHRVVMAAPAGRDVNHINHNALDNRQANLRVVDRATTCRNRKPVEVRGICKGCGLPFHLPCVPSGAEAHQIYCTDACRRWPVKRAEREATARWKKQQGVAG